MIVFLINMPAMAQSQSALKHLEFDLQGPLSATEVLTERCTQLKLASPPVIRAVRETGPELKPSSQVRALLGVKSNRRIRYRRVRLVCGDHLLSEADNWYVPDRLSTDMNNTLDTTQTSFGTVVKPLAFHRRTLEMAPLKDPAHALRVTALLVSGAGMPFSVVVENYSRVLIEGTKTNP